jgi:catechol 2,3-dioxygenase-like lactoylglutathione lyase family enzyme
MKPLFVSSVSVVSSSPAEDRRLFVDVLGLPLAGDQDYVFTEGLRGVKHFGVWPLAQAAQSCFATDTWPVDRPVPQASVEFDVEDVTAAADELQAQGYELLHPPRTEPWGQTIVRLQSPGGLIVGVSITPWMREAREPDAESE